MTVDAFKQWLDGDTSKPAHTEPTIVRKYDVPWLAGPSNDGKSVYIDRRVPLRIKVELAKGDWLPIHRSGQAAFHP